MSVRLTERQEECLRLSVTMTDKEIARTLGISANTVDKHIREATRRLGVSRRKEALRLLGSNPPYASGAIHQSVADRLDQGVDADLSVEPPAANPADQSLYGRYSRLGALRTPPRSFKVRTLTILGWTAFGAILLVTVIGLIGMMFGVADGFAPTGANP
ncbi:MAG TPA: helix-turn-helix transcriptional regulator [Brevundimonas sp.]|jgi:DNA-binding CsgD family transcriptional regulator|nr:helix-turn-helix transcriptional regulator [Brevundimonas sp.]